MRLSFKPGGCLSCHEERVNIGALIITYPFFGVPHYGYSIRGTQKILIMKAPVLFARRCSREFPEFGDPCVFILRFCQHVHFLQLNCPGQFEAQHVSNMEWSSVSASEAIFRVRCSPSHNR